MSTSLKSSSLLHTIQHLKNEIQFIIDKLKGEGVSAQEKTRLNTSKQEKMAALRNANNKLREVLKDERAAKAKAKETLQATRAVDSLVYNSSKPGKSQEAAVKVRKARAEREAAMQQYTSYEQYKTEYNKHDPEKYPGFLFLAEEVLSNYGPCPFVKMDIKYNEEDEQLMPSMTVDRKAWLESQQDGGTVYFNLYEKLVEQKELNLAKSELIDAEKDLLDFYKSATEKNEGASSLASVLEFAEEYVKCTIKTKRIKERYKTFIHTL